MFGQLVLAVGLALLGGVSAVNPTVRLNYTTYQGTALPNGITQWLGIRFAAPPVGNLRFAPPQDPLVNTTTQIANTVSIPRALLAIYW